VFVLAVELFWPPAAVEEAVELEEVADAADPEAEFDDVDVAAVPLPAFEGEPLRPHPAELAVPTSDLPPPFPKPPEFPRLPRNCGAMRATKFSAATIPLTRIVRSIFPVAMVAVRMVNAPAPGCASLWRLASQMEPAIASITAAIHSQPRLRLGSRGLVRNSSGGPGGLTGGAMFGTEALLILK